MHLRAQWRTLSRGHWPPFDTNILETTGEGKVVGTVYEIANDGLIWWGEGDQKISIDGESFPSTFGTGTEDDYGYAYGNNRPFLRPYHAQTRVDGPGSGGHISLNRWYVLDALPYRDGAPLRPGDLALDALPADMEPRRLLVREAGHARARGRRHGDAGARSTSGSASDMLDPLEGEALRSRRRGGTAGRSGWPIAPGPSTSSGADAPPGERLTVHFTVLRGGPYSVELNLCTSPDYGRHELAVNGKKAEIGSGRRLFGRARLDPAEARRLRPQRRRQHARGPPSSRTRRRSPAAFSAWTISSSSVNKSTRKLL